jgi:hypothetical protein
MPTASANSSKAAKALRARRSINAKGEPRRRPMPKRHCAMVAAGRDRTGSNEGSGRRASEAAAGASQQGCAPHQPHHSTVIAAEAYLRAAVLAPLDHEEW